MPGQTLGSYAPNYNNYNNHNWLQKEWGIYTYTFLLHVYKCCIALV